MRCARHPQVETELECGRCSTPICPKCLVHTPVGARCPDCAQVRRLPTYQVSPLHHVKAALASGIAGSAGGAIWAYLIPFDAGFFFAFFLGAALGYGIAGSVERATNLKRGPGLQMIAAGGVVVAYLVRNLLEGENLVPSGDLFGYVLVVIAAIVAVNRLR